MESTLACQPALGCQPRTGAERWHCGSRGIRPDRRIGRAPGASTGAALPPVSRRYEVAMMSAMSRYVRFPLESADELRETAAELRGGRRCAGSAESKLDPEHGCAGAPDGAAPRARRPSADLHGPGVNRFAPRLRSHGMLAQVLLSARHEVMRAARSPTCASGGSASHELSGLRRRPQQARSGSWGDCRKPHVAADAAHGQSRCLLAPWAMGKQGHER